MARKLRQISRSGYYHVMLRGVNRQAIFFDNTDWIKMKNCLKQYSRETGIEICVYCLMDNHVHLLLHCDGIPSKLIQKIACSYVYYFNHKYERDGHLLQDRYKCEIIETEKSLLTVARYILRNPQKAGICRYNEYPWSSWAEIETKPDITNYDLILKSANGLQNFRNFVSEDNNDMCMDILQRHHLTDEQAKELIHKETGLANPLLVSQLPRSERDHIIGKIKRIPLPERQISRLTGLSRNIIRKC